jgi:undecaprenyl-diphosphatase
VHVHLDPPLTPASVLLPRRRLLVGLALLLVALAFAAALAGGQTLLTWDEPIQRGVEARRTTGLDDFFLTVSRLGSTVIVLALGSIASIVTWRRCRAAAVAIVVATFSRPLIEFVLKAVVERDRPNLQRLVTGTGYSFPSGHVMAAVALWGLLPMIVGLYTRRRALWWASVAVAGVLIVSIAASRVYLGVHWFSDVTGGLVVGTFFLLGVDAVLRRAHGVYPCGLLPCPDPADEPDASDAPCFDASELAAVGASDASDSADRKVVATSAAASSSA